MSPETNKPHVTEQLRGLRDVAIVQPEVDPFTQTQVVQEQVMDEHTPVLFGIKSQLFKIRARRQQDRLAELDYDTKVYQEAAAGSPALHSNKSPAPYNPLSGFHMAHRANREEFSATKRSNRALDDAKPVIRARTDIQAFASLRANMRTDAIHKRNRKVEKFESIYKEYLVNDDGSLKTPREVKHSLKGTRHLAGNEKKAIKKAGKLVRKTNRSRSRLESRLHSQNTSTDIGGRAIYGLKQIIEKRATKINK